MCIRDSVTTAHPLGFVIDNSSLFEVISGTPFSSPKTIEGKSIQHYTGDIVVEVKGDFGQISYNCYRHGYMGGRISPGFGRLVYYEPCSVETPTLTQTNTITETETETITKTETETITETETQSNVKLVIVSHWADFDKKSGRKTSNASQQRFFSTDLGMNYSSENVLDIKWGRE